MPYRVAAKPVQEPEYKRPLIRWNHWKRWFLYRFWWDEGPMDHRRLYMWLRQHDLGLRTRSGCLRGINSAYIYDQT